MTRNLRILIARLGMDAHWTGSAVISKALSDAGMEVVYGGSMLPDEIARTAQQENVDVIGLSTLSGNHLELGLRMMEEVSKLGIEDDVFVVMGGTISEKDGLALKEKGVLEIFGTGTNTTEVVKFINRQFE